MRIASSRSASVWFRHDQTGPVDGDPTRLEYPRDSRLQRAMVDRGVRRLRGRDNQIERLIRDFLRQSVMSATIVPGMSRASMLRSTYRKRGSGSRLTAFDSADDLRFPRHHLTGRAPAHSAQGSPLSSCSRSSPVWPSVELGDRRRVAYRVGRIRGGVSPIGRASGRNRGSLSSASSGNERRIDLLAPR